MAANYLIRLDDACATMDLEKWCALEKIFQQFEIKPIVAVVPANKDPDLNYAPPDAGFWDRVRSWQGKGWTIAMHGLAHELRSTNSKLILPFYSKSEFGGLPFDRQAQKIRRAWEIFSSHGVHPKIWIAPAHTFDKQTLKALTLETPIRVVSDGLALDQYFEHGVYWLPQQLWRFEEKRSGLWTVCLHPNSLSLEQISRIQAQLERRYHSRIASFDNLVLQRRRRTVPDRLFSMCFWLRHQLGRVRRRLAELINSMHE